MNRRWLGLLFIAAAGIGAAICIIGIFLTWRTRPAFTQAAADQLQLLGETLSATGDGLTVVGQVVETTATDIALVTSSISTLTLALEDTHLILQSLTTLTGEDLPATLAAAQTSLASAQASALLIDNLMSTLTSIPLLGMDAYRPEVPLNVALGDISESLEPLGPSLESVSEGLAGAAENLESLETQLAAVQETSQEIDAALIEAQTVITDYQAIVADFTARVDAAQQSLPRWSTTGAWVVTLLLGTLLFAQVGLGERGFELARRLEQADNV